MKHLSGLHPLRSGTPEVLIARNYSTSGEQHVPVSSWPPLIRMSRGIYFIDFDVAQDASGPVKFFAFRDRHVIAT